MSDRRPAFIFGAGASKACGGPLTDEILYDAYCDEALRTTLERPREIELLRECLMEHFHVPRLSAERKDYPSLPLLLSLLDLLIEHNRPLPRRPQFPKGLGRQELTKVRATIEYVIFAVLDYHLRAPIGTAYRRLLSSPLIGASEGLRAISLNYDIMLDNLMCEAAQRHKASAAPDYGCDIRTEAYASKERFGKLLKLHGSLNWMYCPGCQRLDIGMTQSGKALADSSLLEELYNFKPLDQHYLCSDESCDECQCRYCGTPLRAIMVTPSFVKDYRNPHIQQIWYQAEWLLRESTHAYIVGYSLPNEDMEVIHLLRRGLENVPPENVTVVLQDPDDGMVRRYMSLFGSKIALETHGFEAWAARLAEPASVPA